MPMTFEQILAWCRANGVHARGVYRGKDFLIRQSDTGLPGDLPALDAIFHWDLEAGERHLPTSPSDMERLVSGKMTLEIFKSTVRGAY